MYGWVPAAGIVPRAGVAMLSRPIGRPILDAQKEC